MFREPSSPALLDDFHSICELDVDVHDISELDVDVHHICQSSDLDQSSYLASRTHNAILPARGDTYHSREEPLG